MLLFRANKCEMEDSVKEGGGEGEREEEGKNQRWSHQKILY